jgi:hypothetical protein
MTKQDTTQQVYVATDGDGDEMATCATYARAVDAIRDHLSFDAEHERDLGTLATWQGTFATALPFSGACITFRSADCDRSLALARCHDIELDDVSESTWGENSFDADGGEYLVLTESESRSLAMKQCAESAWAFNVDFLSSYLPDGGEVALQAMRDSDLCESANEAVIALLGSRADEAFSDAIDCDGIGHFLAGYDGNEFEYRIGGTDYLIYRTN